MTEEKNNTTPDLLGIIERLVDNLQETNTSNNEMLHSVNISLVKVADALPELKNVSDKVTKLDTDTVMNEVRSISTNLKIFLGVIGIILCFGMAILGLYQAKFEDNVVKEIAIATEKIFDDHIQTIDKQIKTFEDMKKK